MYNILYSWFHGFFNQKAFIKFTGIWLDKAFMYYIIIGVCLIHKSLLMSMKVNLDLTQLILVFNYHQAQFIFISNIPVLKLPGAGLFPVFKLNSPPDKSKVTQSFNPLFCTRRINEGLLQLHVNICLVVFALHWSSI